MGGRLGHMSAKAFLMLLYLAFVSAAAYSLWAVLLKHNPVSKVAIFGFMNPVCGVLLSTILLDEKAFWRSGDSSTYPCLLGYLHCSEKRE